MKKLIWLLPFILTVSCSKGKKIEVSGVVQNSQEETIYLEVQGVSGNRMVDSMKLKKEGRFSLNDHIEYPTFYNLHLENQDIIPLLMSPGTNASITTDIARFATGYSIVGSPESTQIQALNERLAMTRHGIDSLRLILESNPIAGDEMLADIAGSYEDLVKAQRRYSIEFVLENLSSMVSIYALYQKLNANQFVLNENRDIQMLKITSQTLDTIYPGSEQVMALKRDAEALENELYSRHWREIISSSAASFPEIRLPDPFGDTVSLRSLKGSVILLSFWASWDEVSVAQNLDWKKLYKKYHAGGFEIYQVSMDTELQSWLGAIQYDELPWINVSELTYPESSVAGLYNVQEFPASFLIDREGNIVGKDFSLAELDIRISQLLN